MASLYKRGDVWYSKLYIGGKPFRKALHTDKAIAQAKLGDLIRRRRDVAFGAAPQEISWDEFKERYFAAFTKHEGTLKQEHAAVRAFEAFQRPRKLEDVTPELLQRWVARRLGEGRKPGTINRQLRVLKYMMRQAEAWKLIEPQNWRSVKKLREAAGKVQFFEVEELQALVDLATGCWKTAVLLGSRAGLRRGEIRWLAWEDVDFKRERVHVCPKPGWVPKDYEQRWIPIPPDVVRHLRSLRRRGEWVLIDTAEKRPTLGSMTNYVRKLIRRAKLKGNIKKLRHTYASHLAIAGVSMRKIKDLLGHASTKTTEIYAHLSPEATKKAVEALPVIRS